MTEKPKFQITLEYADLKVTIETNNIHRGADADCFLLASACMEKRHELGNYGKPKVNIEKAEKKEG